MNSSLHSQYQQDGFVVARSLYPATEMADWKQRIIDILTDQNSLDTPSGVNVWFADELDPFFAERMADPQVVSILAKLIGSPVEFLSVKPVFKNKATTFASPWHQDWAYWQGIHKISVWLALEDATRANGCLKVIPGSHTRALEMKQVDEEVGFPFRLEEADVADLPVEVLEVQAGDAVFFHDLLLHASLPNPNGLDRWALISTYRNAAEEDPSTVWQSSFIVG